MKATIALAILMLSASLAAAQDKMAEQLKKAIVEEESNQNLDKAIHAYQSILAQFDEERQTAATALFHLADCYRKQGKKDQAIAAYSRVVQEFSDQTKLADASRNYLSKTYGVSQNPNAAAAGPSLREIADARLRYRALLQQQVALVEDQIQGLEKQVDTGAISRSGPEMTAVLMELLDLRRTMAAVDAGAMPIPNGANNISGVSQNPNEASKGLAQRETAEARQRYRQLLQQQIALVENQIQGLQKKVEAGVISHGEMTAAQMQLLDLKRTLAAFDAGALPIPHAPTKK
jgi:tetratricopeptide (TPR) repeat protein